MLLFQRLIFQAAAVLKINSGNKRQFLLGKLYDLRKRIPVWWGMLLTQFKRRSSGETSSESLVLARIWRANDRASDNYVPKPYPGAVTDFRPARQYRALDKPDLKWDRLAGGGQRVVVVPGYPAVMLLEPYVRDLAAMLTTCIDEALRLSNSSPPEEILAVQHGVVPKRE